MEFFVLYDKLMINLLFYFRTVCWLHKLGRYGHCSPGCWWTSCSSYYQVRGQHLKGVRNLPLNTYVRVYILDAPRGPGARFIFSPWNLSRPYFKCSLLLYS